MACNFLVPIGGDADKILKKVQSSIEGQGGTFEGDADSGKFSLTVMSNTIAGSYKVIGSDLEMNIDEKPFFIPCSTIESFLKSKLA